MKDQYLDNKFTLIWSFRNRISILKESILTADKTCPKDIDFCLVDASSSDDTIKDLREFCNGISDRVVRICESTYRSSLSEAWNLGMMLTKNRYVVFASSDTIFKKSGWYDSLYNEIIINGHEYVLVENHALFGFDKRAISKMGWFDEEFEIGPHFDVDFMIRASENGVQFKSIQNVGYYTHGEDDDTQARIAGDVTDRLPMHEDTNDKIFKDKWDTSWPGWKHVGGGHRLHPPVHISQVKRKTTEIDPHPIYTKKIYRET
tara:strand:- start:287 stop:1069 length:783 start_codon:yes stop_codon:yes gene_type:complete